MFPLYSLDMALDFGKGEEAATVLRALQPEMNAKHERRSTASVKVKNNALVIGINADDAAALRAAVNSMLNSIILSKKVREVK